MLRIPLVTQYPQIHQLQAVFPSSPESPQLQLPQLQSPQDLQLPVPQPLAPSFPPSAPFRRRCAKQPWKFRQLVGNVGKGRILGYREGDQAYVPMFLCSLLSNLLNTVNGLNDLIDDSILVERKMLTSIRLDHFTETVSKDAQHPWLCGPHRIGPELVLLVVTDL